MTKEQTLQMNMLKLIVLLLFACLLIMGNQRNKVAAENVLLKKQVRVAEKALKICSYVNRKLDEERQSAEGCE